MKDSEKTIADQSFYNEALTGSGTITEDGTYAEPQPDPTVVRGLGPQKTSGGRDVVLNTNESTGPSSQEDPTTRKQASANPKK
jgi:hypothetical protein